MAMVGRCAIALTSFSLKTTSFRLFFIEVGSCSTLSLNFRAYVRLQGTITIVVGFNSMCDCFYSLLVFKTYSISLGGYCRITFVFFPRRISFAGHCLIRTYSSPTTRDGLPSSSDALPKLVSLRIQGKRTKITWRIREIFFSLNVATFFMDFTHYSPLHGLILAVKDPKVVIWSLMNVSQALGMSFVNFFPTSAYVLLNRTHFSLTGFPS